MDWTQIIISFLSGIIPSSALIYAQIKNNKAQLEMVENEIKLNNSTNRDSEALRALSEYIKASRNVFYYFDYFFQLFGNVVQDQKSYLVDGYLFTSKIDYYRDNMVVYFNKFIECDNEFVILLPKEYDSLIDDIKSTIFAMRTTTSNIVNNKFQITDKLNSIGHEQFSKLEVLIEKLIQKSREI